MLPTYKMSFQGEILKRGFWLYVWQINSERKYLYIGQTGDSSSPFASSAFIRAARHLDLKDTAKSNSLFRKLKTADIDYLNCQFEMLAIGPIDEEQQAMPEHSPLAAKIRALEGALANELKNRGYEILSTHHKIKNLDDVLFRKVLIAIERDLPRLS
jgi:hypothetical protein